METNHNDDKWLTLVCLVVNCVWFVWCIFLFCYNSNIKDIVDMTTEWVMILTRFHLVIVNNWDDIECTFMHVWVEVINNKNMWLKEQLAFWLVQTTHFRINERLQLHCFWITFKHYITFLTIIVLPIHHQCSLWNVPKIKQ